MEKPNTHPDKYVGFTSWQEFAHPQNGWVTLPAYSELAGKLINDGIATVLKYGMQLRIEDLPAVVEKALAKKDLSLVPVTGLRYEGDTLVLTVPGDMSATRVHKAFADRYGLSRAPKPIASPFVKEDEVDDSSSL